MKISPDSFAMISESAFRRLASGDQHTIVKAAVAFFPEIEKQYGVNADARWKIVAEAARIYRDRMGAPGRIAAPAKSARADAPVTAAECNEWLRGLPPVPAYPAVCDCPVCVEPRNG